MYRTAGSMPLYIISFVSILFFIFSSSVANFEASLDALYVLFFFSLFSIFHYFYFSSWKISRLCTKRTQLNHINDVENEKEKSKILLFLKHSICTKYKEKIDEMTILILSYFFDNHRFTESICLHY